MEVASAVPLPVQAAAVAPPPSTAAAMEVASVVPLPVQGAVAPPPSTAAAMEVRLLPPASTTSVTKVDCRTTAAGAPEVTVLSSKLVKPAAVCSINGAGAGVVEESDAAAGPPPQCVPLSIFDAVTYQIQMAIIYAFAAPAPSTAAVEDGLAAALAHHRMLAGQLVPDGGAVILNDHGARLVEAYVDADLVDMAPPKPKPELLRLHPDLEAEHDEIVVVQLTRFRCGSLAVGFTAHHGVTDGRGTSNFLVAWGRATRGLPMGLPPVYHRDDLFRPRIPPAPLSPAVPSRPEFDHRNREYYLPPSPLNLSSSADVKKSIVIHKAHFTKDLIARLRAKASEGRAGGRQFSRFETILAHLWHAVTRARGLRRDETSTIRLSVDGRDRLGVPAEYAGNLVLWAFPRATVAELLDRPLRHAAEAIHEEVARVDAAYFRSFVDFARSGAVEAEGLAPSAALNLRDVLCPDMEVHSWLSFPFYELDFGTGSPTYVMPAYFPAEGLIFLMPSYIGDGSVDAFVPLFHRNLDAFKHCCYSMD